jgi:hypothetical protein
VPEQMVGTDLVALVGRIRNPVRQVKEMLHRVSPGS